MRRVLLHTAARPGLLMAVVVGAWITPPPSLAAPFVTLRGSIVEVACLLDADAAGKGEAHAACAMRCAKNGDPMALVTDDGVYVIEGSYAADKNARLLDFVSRRVEAKGTTSERDGRAFINIAAMMVQK